MKRRDRRARVSWKRFLLGTHIQVLGRFLVSVFSKALSILLGVIIRVPRGPQGSFSTLEKLSSIMSSKGKRKRVLGRRSDRGGPKDPAVPSGERKAEDKFHGKEKVQAYENNDFQKEEEEEEEEQDDGGGDDDEEDEDDEEEEEDGNDDDGEVGFHSREQCERMMKWEVTMTMMRRTRTRTRTRRANELDPVKSARLQLQKNI